MDNFIYIFSEYVLVIFTLVVVFIDLFIIVTGINNNKTRAPKSTVKTAAVFFIILTFVSVISTVRRFNITKMPNVVGMSHDNAVQTLSLSGLENYYAKDYGSGCRVIYQSEKSGSIIAKKTKIILETADSSAGLSADEGAAKEQSGEPKTENIVGDVSGGEVHIYQGGEINIYEKSGTQESDKYDFNWIEEISDPQKRAEAYNNEGLKFYAQKKYIEAVDLYTRAIEMNDSYQIEDIDVCYNNRGIAYFEGNLITDAIRDFTKAIELNPGAAKYYADRADAYLINGNVEKYMEDLQKYSELSGVKDIFNIFN